jgi:hypothetical protein
VLPRGLRTMPTTTGSARGRSELCFDVDRSLPCVLTVFSPYMRELIRAQAPLAARQSLLPGTKLSSSAPYHLIGRTG